MLWPLRGNIFCTVKLKNRYFGYLLARFDRT